jgi:hypothetical protein
MISPQVKSIKPPAFDINWQSWGVGVGVCVGVQYEQTNQFDVWLDEWGHESFIHPT